MKYPVVKTISLVMACLMLSCGQQRHQFAQTEFTSEERSLSEIGLEDYPYNDIVSRLLGTPVPNQWSTTGVDRELYLDLMEKIVRMAAAWVNDEGAVIDPYFKAEFGQTTPRFVSSAAILLHFGRIADLKPLVTRAMTYSCTRLANRTADSPDFWMRELTTAFIRLEPLVPEELVFSWRESLRNVDPERTYRVVDTTRQKLHELHNWAVYSSGGEYVREAIGLTDPSNEFLQGTAFFETYMEPQLVHFTKEGMYRDPNDPITYDITTRLQIANALYHGYKGKLYGPYTELLRRGGLSMLLFTSPTGTAPFGGRSSQFHFQEAIIAALSELEASRYKDTNERLAGAFKRQAHLSVMAITRWVLDMDPLRHMKNGFAPETEHGIDRYGKYSVYSLYCSSVLGLAALYADDEIREYPTFAETGGYLFEIYPAFHKVFATVNNTHIEIETKGDFHHEATGLGRFHLKDVPVELGLSMSFTATPSYRMADSLKPESQYSIGPAWRTGGETHSLANLSDDLVHNLVTRQITMDTVEFDIQYQSERSRVQSVTQRYKLFASNVSIITQVESETPVDSVYFIVPLLVSSGSAESHITQRPGEVTIDYLGHRLTIGFDRRALFEIDRELFANRNAIYRNLVIRKPANSIRVNLKLE